MKGPSMQTAADMARAKSIAPPTFYAATPSDPDTVAGWVGYPAYTRRGRPVEDLVPVLAGATCDVIQAPASVCPLHGGPPQLRCPAMAVPDATACPRS